MPKRTRSYDRWLLTELTDPIVAANYINAASEDSEEMLLVAMRNVAEAHRMARIARDANLSRESLYKTLSSEGNPRLQSFRAILNTFGLKIQVAPKGFAGRTEARTEPEVTCAAIDVTKSSQLDQGSVTIATGALNAIFAYTTTTTQTSYQAILVEKDVSFIAPRDTPAPLLMQAARSKQITVGS